MKKTFVIVLLGFLMVSLAYGQEKVTVTLNIFSGRSNPSWQLSDSQVALLTEKLATMEGRTLQRPVGKFGFLGYRGFSIEAENSRNLASYTYIHAGVIERNTSELNLMAQDRNLESWLLNTGRENVPEEAANYVKKQMDVAPLFDYSNRGFAVLSVPVYDPGKWNDNYQIRRNNNCYNYGNDLITNTFAQPGRGSGQMYAAITGTEVKNAAVRDGLTAVASPSGTPAQGHYVALVIWPGADFHWYRLDANDYWSHKPGGTEARDWDNSGNKIASPETCDRGPYTEFWGYLHTIPANVTIR